MNKNQLGLAAVNTWVRGFWIAALFWLPLHLSAQTQAPDAKPVPKEAVRDGGTSPASINMYITGGDVRPVAQINGDLYAAGGRVTIEHPVRGDATLTGGAVTVQSPVGDDLRAVGGDIHINSTVGGELYASGGNITLRNTTVVAGAVTLYAGNVSIEGKVNGPLKVYAQKIVLNGEVTRDVELNAEQIELGPQAKLGGALRYPSNAQFKTAAGVIIGGAITKGDAMNGRPDTHHDREWHGQMMDSGPGWASAIASIAAGFFALLAASALLLLVFTGFSHRASERLVSTLWLSLAAGLAILVFTPMLAVILLITLIGIPLGIVVMMLFPLMLLMGWIVGVFSISQWAQRAVQKDAPSRSSANMVGFFALTLLVVLLFGSVPWIGFLILFTIMLLGTGACAIEIYHQLRSGRRSTKYDLSSSSTKTSVVGA